MKRTALLFFCILLSLGLIAFCGDFFSENNPDQADSLKKWTIHDTNRPLPPVVDPGPAKPPTPPPSDAIVLFKGTDLSLWTNTKGEPSEWKVENEYMEVNKTGAILTAQGFGDCQLHVEWASPAQVSGNSQERGNSGVFLMSKYEIQVLDCFNNPTYADGMTAAVYGQFPPLVNACRPPGEWQMYDITFTRPRFDATGNLSHPAVFTVFHNGILVHDHVDLTGPTEGSR
jgi:hypothetical protein